jgi:hypothetical protein
MIAKAVTISIGGGPSSSPREPSDLWDTLLAFDADSRQALFAALHRAQHQCGARVLEPASARSCSC